MAAKPKGRFSGLFSDNTPTASGGVRSTKSNGRFGGLFDNEKKQYNDAQAQAKTAAKSAPKQAPKKGGSLIDKIGSLFLDNTAKTLNTAAEGGKAAFDLAKAGVGAATHNQKAENNALNAGLKARFTEKGSGLFGAGGLASNKELSKTMSAGTVARKVAGGGLGVASEVVPVGRGLGIASKGEKLGKTILKGAVEGAGIGGAASIGNQLVEGKGSAKQTLTDILSGGLLGGAGAGVGRLAGRGVDKLRAKNLSPEELSAKSRAHVPAGTEGVNVDNAASGLAAEDKAAAALKPSEMKMLPAVTKSRADHLNSRLKEIDTELENVRQGKADPNAYHPAAGDNTETLTAGSNIKETKGGGIDQRTSGAKTAGTVTKTDTLVDSSTAAPRLKALKQERTAIKSELDGLNSLPEAQRAAPKVDMTKPEHVHAVQSELDNVERSVASATPAVEKVTGKVNVLRDYAGIGMTKTLKKIGLGKTADKVERSFENMRFAQHTSDHQVADWQKRIGRDKGANQKIFDYLNGDKTIKLNDAQLSVANEMKAEYSKFADRLGIPKNKRITDYITRIFDQDVKDRAKGKNYDPLVNLINDGKASDTVSNPFTRKRTGASGYTRDAFKAFQAYTVKANRQIHMSGVVKDIAEQSKQADIDTHTADYLARASQTLSGRQKQQFIDKVLDGVVDSALGTNRGGTRALRATRNAIYRGTMGLNIGSAVQNLTQGVNTFADMGARDTMAGMSKFLRTMKDAAVQKGAGKGVTAFDELERNGVFDSNIREDSDLGKVKNFFRKTDKGLWAMFDTAEKINRGTAYFAAKNKALRQNLSEEAAQEAGRKAVNKTQFKFDEIHTPLGLQSDVVKSLAQFQSFGLRQTEYLGSIAKGAVQGNPQDIARAVRWLGANAVVYGAIGNVLGMDWKNSIPLLSFRGVTTPTVQVGEDVKNIVQGKDKYGNDIGRGKALKASGKDLAALLVPGGTQLKKTIEGAQAANSGFSKTDSGRVRFQVDPKHKLQAEVFGQYSLPESKAHFAGGNTQSLSAHQSEVIQNIDPSLKPQYMSFFESEQGMTKQRTDARKQVTDLVNQGNINQAQRKAEDWNKQVDQQFGQFFRDHPDAQSDLVDVYAGYKIPIAKTTFTKKKTKDTSKY